MKDLTTVFKTSPQIPISDQSKIVIMSDCHRGDGTWADDFAKNQNIYFSALTDYLNAGYTYIELGDGDELWENDQLKDIINVHKHVFWLLNKFFERNRLYMIYGNHDIVKRNKKYVKEHLYYYYDERLKKRVPLFKGIDIHEGLVLYDEDTGDKIFLVHGHQVDFLNSNLWRMARFLVRYVWRPLELFGVNDPTSTAKNYKKKEKVERKLTEWVKKEDQMLIAGHTHRPVFPDADQPLYFNDGSCVHPRCITAIEISNGEIMLVKWCVKTRVNGTLYIGREILAGPERLSRYLHNESDDRILVRYY